MGVDVQGFALLNTEKWTSSGDALAGKPPTPAVWLCCKTNFLCRSAHRVATSLVYESGWCSPGALQSLWLRDPLKLEQALPWLLPAFQRPGESGGRGVLSFHRNHRRAGGRGLRIMKKAGPRLGRLTGGHCACCRGQDIHRRWGALRLGRARSKLSTVCNSTPLAAVPSPKDSSICPLATSRFWVVSVPTEGWAIAVFNRVSLPGISPRAALSCPAVPAPPSRASGKPQWDAVSLTKSVVSWGLPQVREWGCCGHIPHRVCILGAYTVGDCWPGWPPARASAEELPLALSSDCNIQEDVFSFLCTPFLPHSCTHLTC